MSHFTSLDTLHPFLVVAEDGAGFDVEPQEHGETDQTSIPQRFGDRRGTIVVYVLAGKALRLHTRA